VDRYLKVIVPMAIFASALAVGIAGAQAMAQLTPHDNHTEGDQDIKSSFQDSTELPPVSSTPVLSQTVLIPILVRDPTPTSPPPPPTPTNVPEPSWLTYLNLFRTNTGLEPLSENESWSGGGWFHSRYMVKNDYVGHSEDPGNPWYSAEGYAAAQNGNVFVSSWLDTSDETSIDFWMTAPFHAISMLDPQLHTTGLGIYHEVIGQWKTGSTLDVRRGRGEVPEGTIFPIPFPADGGATWLTTYYGGEFPDPLSNCPGFSPPTGPPIMLQLGSGDLTPQVIGHRLWENGILLESCQYDETSYINPNPSMQSTGRIVLNNRDAVVIMPRYPLVAGSSYAVEITTIDSTITWSFDVDSGALDAFELDPFKVQMGPTTFFDY